MSLALRLALWASTALDAALLVALALGPRGPLTLARALRAAWLTAIVSSAKAVGLLLAAHGMSQFLLIHIAWLDLVVALPLASLVVLVASRRRTVVRSVQVLTALALLVVPIAVWGTFVEPYRLVLETARVPLDPARGGSSTLRVAVLSDLQMLRVGEHERRAVQWVVELEPDLILLPGDLLQVGRHEREQHVEPLRELLQPLVAPLGAWMVLGNVDSQGFLLRVLAGTPVKLLVNEEVELLHGDRRIRLAGVDLTARSPSARELLRRLEEQPGDEVRLLLAHLPDVAWSLSSPSRVDLLVAGHTHGGQVRLPWLGPPIKLSSVPRRVAAGGLHELDGRRLYVSRGVGVERSHAPRLRLNCPPEVSLLVLEGAAADR